MAKEKSVVQQAVLKNAVIEKLSGVFEKDGEKIEYDKLTLIVDGFEFDISMDSGVKKLFVKIVQFEDVDVED